MGAHRHDLLVAMRVVNKIELEMVQSEWESWLRGETRRCELVRDLLMRDDGGDGGEKTAAAPSVIPGGLWGQFAGDEGGDGGGGGGETQRRTALREWFAEYCASCAAEERKVHERMGVVF